MYSDSIGDMLARIKNAYLSKKQIVKLPYSKVKEKIVKILVRNGFLADYQLDNKDKLKQLLILTLKYKRGEPAITEIKRVSKPSRRLYSPKDKLPYVLSGYGIGIVSTSQGLMTNKEARKKGLGGEIICKVW